MTIVGDRAAGPGVELRFADSPTPDDDGTPAAPRRAGTWLVEQWAEHLWPTIVLFAVLASAATLTSSPGLYIGDNRFEQYWNPARRIAKTFALWDGSRGLGRIREDFWPATTMPVALLRGLGADPILAEHLFHAMCIAMAGVGMVAVVRLFRPRIGVEHIMAGLTMAFGAFSATFLLPSNLYFHFALAPWLFVVTYKGLLSGRPWRWAAVFALLVFAPGNVDTPGLIYNVVPLVPLCLYLVFVERAVRLRDVIGWFARAFVLTVLVNAVVLAKTVFAAAALGQRLNDTEAADIAALTSSWSESLRGLGNWLTYFPNAASSGGGLLKPQGEPYLVNPAIIAFTFVPPCIALFTLWQSRWRTRILYVMLMLSSLVILVGAFPRSNSSPLGRQILNAYTNIKLLTAFRNTYKIGAGLAIGVAALFAAGVMMGYRAVRRRRPSLRWVPIAGGFLTITVIAFPFWTGNLYNPTQTAPGVPGYWSEAMGWLDQLPDQGRSLILPQTSRTRYRWGWVGDDIFDALLTRPHAIATGVPLSTPVGANAVEAMTMASAEPEYTPGVLGPMARRLGITEIVIRNDIDWQAMDRPRPLAFDGVRTDPDFEKVATFGAPGEYTTADTDFTDQAKLERQLPPVEVYRLKGTTGILRTQTGAPPILTSGDANGWPSMARAGLLSSGAPVAYTGDTTPEQLAEDLRAGSPLVVTDSNRRRLRVLLSYEPDYSYLLTDGQDLDRPAQSLFKDPGSQTLSWYPDAKGVHVEGSPRSTGGTQVWNRPSYALDGDPKTAWMIRRFDRPFEHIFHIDLRESTRIDAVTIRLPSNTTKGDGIREGTLRFSDGTEQKVSLTGTLADGTGDGFQGLLDVPHDVTWVEFAPTEIGERDQILGVADLILYTDYGAHEANCDPTEDSCRAPGAGFRVVDLSEYTQLPDDVFREAAADPALAELVGTAPTGYVFERNIRLTQQTPPSAVLSGAQSTDEELMLRRRFQVVGTHDFEVSGQLRLRSDTPDSLVDELIGGEVGAYGDRRGGQLNARGANAVDGVPVGAPGSRPSDSTAWVGPASDDTTLTVRFPEQQLRTVRVSSRFDGDSTKYNLAFVSLPKPGTTDEPGELLGQIDLTTLDPACDSPTTDLPAVCVRQGTLDLGASGPRTDKVVLTFGNQVTQKDPETKEDKVVRQKLVGQQIRVDDVQINGRDNTTPTTDQVVDRCVDLGLLIGTEGSAPTSVPVRIEGTVADLLAGASVPFSACRGITLSSGWQRLVTGPNAPFDQVQLLTPDLAAATGRPASSTATPAVNLTMQSSTQLKMELTDVPAGTTLLFDQSWDGGWRAFVNGQPVGAPRELDAVNAWTLEGSGRYEVELRYNPQRNFAISLVITGVGIALCIFLIAWRPRRREPADG